MLKSPKFIGLFNHIQQKPMLICRPKGLAQVDDKYRRSCTFLSLGFHIISN
ncbi:unnamed protein product [Hymenolepis diminuta]|uniref:Uncharacterized protein n=1 Tax=Hymenolepis diminuta TaxID=6216 RepID=A0A564Z3M9_HYMDI|nr:unnamed protein product [Hymenolepis diminuta]